MTRPRRHRRVVALHGAAEDTRARAEALVRRLPPEDVLWAGARDLKAVQRRLGRACDAVVLDLHDGLDADLLALAHGFVWGGGALVLRVPPSPPPTPALVVEPYGPADVGTRLWTRLQRRLPPEPAEAGFLPPLPLGEVRGAAQPSPTTGKGVAGAALTADRAAAPVPLEPASHAVRGTEEQDAVVARLASILRDPVPSATTLLADRGRGKSSALGLALRQVGARIAVSAPQPESAAEVLRFAGPLPFVDPTALARGGEWDVIVVDEAAQLPVPLLRRIAERHPRARLAFATTTRGYEGTGRGFVLRFLAWLERQERPVVHLTLRHPIRWDPDDPLERWVFDLLLLDAEPAPIARGPAVMAPVMQATARRPHEAGFEVLEAGAVDRDALAADEGRLRALFGLLVHAHYRTTPSDLHRLLDAPNLRLHALGEAAVTLVAEEGALPSDSCEALARGERRIRGHALPDTLISHAGEVGAGALSFVRSVRIAVHPELRRGGLGRRLVEEVHRSWDPDAFGTIFGATPELLRFRREVGYEVVRVGVSRGSRTGEPAVVMLSPRSAPARALFERLRATLARDLPLQLELLQADGEVLDPELIEALRAGLPPPTPLTDDEARAAIARYVHGPAPYESAAAALGRHLERHGTAGLQPEARALVEGRVRDRKGWITLAGEAGTTVPAVMRALRRAVAEWTA